MKKLIKLILFLMMTYPLTGAIFSACSGESDCSTTGRSMVYANMCTINPEIRAILNDTLNSLTVTAFGTDSIIINSQKKAHDIALPLRYTSDSTILVFHHTPPLRDTMVIRRTNTPCSQSMDYGHNMKQNIISIHPIDHTDTNRKKYHSIDPIYIKSNTANTNGIENLKIFYRCNC